MSWSLLLTPLAAALLLLPQASHTLPGCPNPNDLGLLDYLDVDDIDALPLCFCDRPPAARAGAGVNVLCTYGARPDHVRNAIEAVAAANLTLAKLELQYVAGKEWTPADDTLAGVPPAGQFEFVLRGCEDGRDLAGGGALAAGLLAHVAHTVTALTIAECSIGTVPAGLRALTSLRKLTLDGVQLGSLAADDLEGLERLEVLELADNHLKSIEPSALVNHPKLHTLRLGPRNDLDESVFAALRKAKALRVLDMRRAGLKALPSGFLSGLNKLEELHLLKNNIENVTSGAFAGLPKLQLLDMRVNLIERIEPLAFDQLANLATLRLAGNYISEIDADTFGPGLAKLEFLDIGANEMATLRKDTFRHLAGLTRLDVQTTLDYPYLDSIESGAFNGLSQLTRLNLSATNVSQLPADIFYPLPNLERLDLGQTSLTSLPNGAFKKNAKLAELHLDQTRMDSIDASIFDDIGNLRVVDLSGNDWLCDESMLEVVDWLNRRNSGSAPFLWLRPADTLCGSPAHLRDRPLGQFDAAALAETTTTSAAAVTEPATTAAAAAGPRTLPPFLLAQGWRNLEDDTGSKLARADYWLLRAFALVPDSEQFRRFLSTITDYRSLRMHREYERFFPDYSEN